MIPSDFVAVFQFVVATSMGTVGGGAGDDVEEKFCSSSSVKGLGSNDDPVSNPVSESPERP